MRGGKTPAVPDYLAVGNISATVLAFEILLLRVFSYSQWNHFASMAVALALLGFGAAGTLLAVLGTRAVRLGDRLFVIGILIGAGGMVTAFLLPHLLTVRPLFAVWDIGELGKLLLLDFVAFIPFFGMALSIGQVFMRWPESTSRLYAANLLGSGLGSLAAVVLLSTLFLETALLALPLGILITGAAFGLYQHRTRKLGLVCAGCALLAVIWLSVGAPKLPLSDFKQLSYLLDLPYARILERQPGLQAEMTVVNSDSIRISPGLSLQWTETIPSQDALVLGSDQVLPLPRTADPTNLPSHLQATLGALPFKLRPQGPVAILGASDWLPVFHSIQRPTTWVEENPHVVRLYRERGCLAGADVRQADPRGFLSSDVGRYSLIFLGSVSMGGDAASEDYLLTVEAIGVALSKLHSRGVLAIPLKLHNPPRFATKLMKVVEEVLNKRGVTEPWQHFAMLRSMQEGILLVSIDLLSEADRFHVRAFSKQWGFDLVALPGMAEGEANRYHLLDSPVFHQTAEAIFYADGEIPTDASWYFHDVPTDAQPYFWKSMKWTNMPALLKEFGRKGLIWLDWALLATVAKISVATALAGILILLPLGRLPAGRKPLTRPRVWLYFSSLGLGFLTIEMVVFQRSILYCANPVATASLVFSAFLVGAGIGSLSTPETSSGRSIRGIFLPIILFAGLAHFLLEWGMRSLSGMSIWVRLAGVAVSIAPLSWSLGRAMPWGLRQLDQARPLIPWAWGINGFASVLAAPLATLLSVHFSQTASWLAGGGCYLAAWAVARFGFEKSGCSRHHE